MKTQSLALCRLHIICPAVYIWAHDTADKHLKNTCNSYDFTNPVKLPQNICAIIPNSITLFGLKLFARKRNIFFFFNLFYVLFFDTIKLTKIILTILVNSSLVNRPSEHRANVNFASSPPKCLESKLNHNR